VLALHPDYQVRREAVMVPAGMSIAPLINAGPSEESMT
jgi:hypothetical protein